MERVGLAVGRNVPAFRHAGPRCNIFWIASDQPLKKGDHDVVLDFPDGGLRIKVARFVRVANAIFLGAVTDIDEGFAFAAAAKEKQEEDGGKGRKTQHTPTRFPQTEQSNHDGRWQHNRRLASATQLLGNRTTEQKQFCSRLSVGEDEGALRFLQHAPLAGEQVRQRKFSNLHAQQSQRRISHRGRHAADLPVFSFDQLQPDPAIRHGFADANRRIARRHLRLWFQAPRAAWKCFPALDDDAARQPRQIVRGVGSPSTCAQ